MELTQENLTEARKGDLKGESYITSDEKEKNINYDEKFMDNYRKNLSEQFHKSSNSSRVRIVSSSFIIVSMVILMFFVAKGGFFEQLSKEKPEDDYEGSFLDMKEYYAMHGLLTKSFQFYSESKNTYKDFSGVVSNCLSEINSIPQNTSQGKAAKEIFSLCWRKIQQSRIQSTNNSAYNIVQISQSEETIDNARKISYLVYMPKYNIDSGNVTNNGSSYIHKIYPADKISGDLFMSYASYIDNSSIIPMLTSFKFESDEMMKISDIKQSEAILEKDRIKKSILLKFSQMSNNIITFSSSISYRLIAMFSVFSVSVFALRWITNELKFTISQNKAFFILMAMPTPVGSIDQMKSIISLTGESVPEADSGDLLAKLLDLVSQGLPKKS
jgi:hypothetical protein